jgi:L-glutamine:scyllo-inosose aminotransferase/L-glutamine:2-deoxy-scyllo-inosose/3-amino-2,3-dideoxy-scyllo-inosose aminotransferase
LDGLLEIAEQVGIALIEDAAQAHGCLWRGKQVGGFGKAGAFSFNQKKLMTCGEGGCIVTNNDLTYQRAFALRDIDGRIAGQTPIRCGGNNQMSSICAAILLAQLERLPAIAAREAKGAEYLCDRLSEIPGIAIPKIRPAVSQQSFYSFGLRLIDESLIANRSQLLSALFDSLSIKLSRSYAPLDVSDLFHPELEPRFRELWQFHPLPGCHQAYSETIRLPHYWLLSAEDVLDHIATAIAVAVDQCHGARNTLSTAGTCG